MTSSTLEGTPPVSLNHCGLPPSAIASRAYNDNPQPLHIKGVRTTHRRLFARLAELSMWEDRALAFQAYMDVAFHLHQSRDESQPAGQLSRKNSYLRFLRGWLFDASSMEGAVLKGWVESRIGIPPTYHRERIPNISSEHYQQYLTDRMNGAARAQAIFAQLDLLYEFVQDELRRSDPTRTHLTLYRGVHDFREHTVLKNLGENRAVVRLNNLNSFTRDFERAWEFGTRVLEVRVPTTKVFFDGDLIHAGILRGEEEVLVIGGEFELRVRVY